MNKTKEIDIYLDKSIKFIKEFAKEIVRENDGFDNEQNIIKLIYRGKILDENLKLGNYIKDSDLIQIFKLSKPNK